MFDPAKLATEIFGILRSFDYVVNIFDFDGNRVYEPADARRFFASPKNITVSIFEDGENSTIKMYLSKSVEVSEISGLISTMRITSSNFGVLFNVRKYERELKPKDLAPNGSADFDAGVSFTGDKQPTNPNHPKLDLDHIHSPDGDQLDRVTDEVSNLNKDFGKISNYLRKNKVKESMDDNLINEADDGQTVKLDIVDMDVEADAWENFKKGYLSYDHLPDLDITDDDAEQYAARYASQHDGQSFDHKTAVKALEMSRIIDAIKGKSPKLAAAFTKALAMFVTGSAPKVIDAVVNKAINCRSHGVDDDNNFHNVPDHDGKTAAKNDMVTIKEFRGRVERQAWQDFVNEYIEFSEPVNFDAVRVGPSGNKLAIYLHLVAEKCVEPGLGNLLSSFADDIANGKGTPFKVRVAKHAIEIAQRGKVNVGESLIMTESIRQFASWFDGFASPNLFESDFPYDDREDSKLDLATVSVKDNFSAEDFLSTIGAHDFDFGDDELGEEDRQVDYESVRTSLVGYLQNQLTGSLDADYPENSDAEQLADDLMPEVVDVMHQSGWEVIDSPIEESKMDGCKCDGECKCDVLATEDVLLPKRPDNDFSREVTSSSNEDDTKRLVAASNTAQASTTPRMPQP